MEVDWPEFDPYGLSSPLAYAASRPQYHRGVAADCAAGGVVDCERDGRGARANAGGGGAAPGAAADGAGLLPAAAGARGEDGEHDVRRRGEGKTAEPGLAD